MTYKRSHICIASTIAALFYLFAAYQVSVPLGFINGACCLMGSVAMFVLFYNYLLLSEKILNNKVIFVGGRILPVEED